MPADMRARLGQTDLPNLVLSASGCAGAGRELAQFIDVARVGAVISKSIMAEPHTGNPAPRLAETPSGLLNSVGLQGPGMDAFLQRDLPWLLSRGARVVRPCGGGMSRVRREQGDAVAAAGTGRARRRMRNEGRHRVRGGEREGHPVRRSVRRHLPTGHGRWLSLYWRVVIAAHEAPDVVGPQQRFGAQRVQVTGRKHSIPGAGKYGGLSGPAIRPVAVRCVWQVRAAFPDVPIIGSGGVRTGRDALELLLAGASMIAVGTEIIHDPSACSRVLRELEEELAAIGTDRAADVIGQAHGRTPRGLAWRA